MRLDRGSRFLQLLEQDWLAYIGLYEQSPRSVACMGLLSSPMTNSQLMRSKRASVLLSGTPDATVLCYASPSIRRQVGTARPSAAHARLPALRGCRAAPLCRAPFRAAVREGRPSPASPALPTPGGRGGYPFQRAGKGGPAKPPSPGIPSWTSSTGRFGSDWQQRVALTRYFATAPWTQDKPAMPELSTPCVAERLAASCPRTAEECTTRGWGAGHE